MIGLDFVKHVDKDWRKHVTYADGSPYIDDYCPLIGDKCRQSDCVFWDETTEFCGYLTKKDVFQMPSYHHLINASPELDDTLLK